MTLNSRMEGVTYFAPSCSIGDKLVSMGKEVRNKDTYGGRPERLYGSNVEKVNVTHVHNSRNS